MKVWRFVVDRRLQRTGVIMSRFGLDVVKIEGEMSSAERVALAQEKDCIFLTTNLK